MKEQDAAFLREECQRLRERLESLERSQREELEGLRGELAAWERRLTNQERDKEEWGTGSAPRKAVVPPPLPVWETRAAPAPVADAEDGFWKTAKRESAAVNPPPLPVKPAPEAHEAEESSFEMRFGKVWLVRLGVVLLLTGLILLGNYAYQNWVRDLPNGLRLAGLVACSAILAEAGRRLARKETLKRFGEVVMAGGLALFYYCAFAAHQVERLRVIDHPVLAAGLLLAAAGAIAAISWIREAKATAVMGLLLASYSTMTQPIGWLSCASSVLLAGVGLVFLLRPGWGGTGAASLAGTYGAFFGWQILGAAGGSRGESEALWFLPPVWALFALPGVMGRFRASLSERARAWFIGANNGLFFLCFSILWLQRHGEYWRVPAVIGLVWVCLGIFGRRRSEVTGGVNLSQGLAVLTLALVLRLDGYHLALSLAAESLALAFAFARFRGRSELGFSLLAAVAATSMTVLDWENPGWMGLRLEPGFPVWSAGIAALMLLAAAVVVRKGLDGGDDRGESWWQGVRASVTCLFVLGLACAISGWCLWLDEPWRLPVTMAHALGFAVADRWLGRKRWLWECLLGSAAFAATAIALLVVTESPASIVAAGVLAGGGCWWFHHRRRSGEEGAEVADFTGGMAWLFSLAVAAAAWCSVERSGWSAEVKSHALMGVTVALAAAAGWWRCGRLVPCAAVLPWLALAFLAAGEDTGWPALGIAVGSWLVASLLAWPRLGGRVEELPRIGAAGLVRLSGFLAWGIAWYRFSPEFWGDWMAAMAVVFLLLMRIGKCRPLYEAAGFVALALCWLVWRAHASPWRELEGDGSWRGWVVVAATWLMLWVWRTRPATPEEGGNRARELQLLGGLACGLTALWSTQLLVWQMDWKPVAVLWTLLGFGFVSGGLWRRLLVLRQAGFVLLGLALLKVFTRDVWDFQAFMRVICFLVLGVVLMLLGLFYHRFAPVMQRLLKEQPGEGRR